MHAILNESALRTPYELGTRRKIGVLMLDGRVGAHTKLDEPSLARERRPKIDLALLDHRKGA
jgi:hypothetical protein